MKKILVTTDFSVSSKAAIYFAIQLASQGGHHLTFFHSYHIMKPTSWNNTALETFEKRESTKVEKKLQQLVESIYKKTGLKKGEYQYVTSNSLNAEKDIREYAEAQGFDFICISRRGASTHKSIFGTVTSGLINKSAVPVIAVPPNYKPKKIEKLLYVSDLKSLDNEVKKVAEFAEPLKADLELLHFRVPSDSGRDLKLINKASEKFSGHQIKMHLRDYDFADGLVKYMDTSINEANPSVVIMFGQQHRDFFARLFLPGISTSYSFKASVPLLIFPRK
jgi:nucleotide-binding universal stress UspA family protein